MQPGRHSQHRRTKRRGDSSDRGLEELDDASPKHRQVATHFGGMRRNDSGRERHAHGGERRVNTRTLAIQRLAAIRPFTSVGGLPSRGCRAVSTGVRVGSRHGSSAIDLMPMTRHGFRIGSNLRVRGRLCHRRLGRSVRHGSMGQRRHAGLPEEQSRTQSGDSRSEDQAHVSRVEPAKAPRKAQFTLLPQSSRGTFVRADHRCCGA